MKTKLLSVLLVGSALITSSCSQQQDTFNYAPPVTYGAHQTEADARIVAAVMAIDKNEIAAANVAERKATVPAVRKFAAYMSSAHSRNLREMHGLSQRINVTPSNGEIARKLQMKGKKALAQLKHAPHGAFDRMYISEMVKGHQEALFIVSQKLIPAARNPVLRNQLEALRAHVNEHLRRAQSIQARLAH